MYKKASVADYILRQGGKPRVTRNQKNGLYHILHLYREGAPQVITHISPLERGTVVIQGVEYQISLLWEFEGGPCEKQSRLVGGEGYPRLRKEAQ